MLGGKRALALAVSDSVIGKRLDLNTKAFTVVGVAPAGVSSLDREVVDLWVPIASVVARLLR